MATRTLVKKIQKPIGKNLIINGGFDFWQRNISQTASGYGSADRWFSDLDTQTLSLTRQDFSSTQTDVPGNPKHFLRSDITAFTPGFGPLDERYDLQHRLESFKELANKTLTLSFWAKADGNKDIALEVTAEPGTGDNSPSTRITGIHIQTISLTTNWQKYTVTFTVPSLNGITLGNDNNNSVSLIFWTCASAQWDSRTNSLGIQSIVFDLAQVKLEEGTEATDFVRAGNTLAGELALCQRYYEKSYDIDVNPGTATSSGGQSGVATGTNSMGGHFMFKVRKRAIPSTWQLYSPATGASGKVRNASLTSDASISLGSTIVGETCIQPSGTGNPFAAGNKWFGHFTADAEL